jgi:SAM-dependent methyltransferase
MTTADRNFGTNATPDSACRGLRRGALCVAGFSSREKPGKALIPGCGTGYEVRAFARSGWQVDAVDFSPEAIRPARKFLGEDRVSCGKRISSPRVRTVRLISFMNASSCVRSRKPVAVRPRADRAIPPHGRVLAGFFFFGSEPEPLPYPLRPGELAALLGERFTQTENTLVSDSLPYFAGKENWQIGRKT